MSRPVLVDLGDRLGVLSAANMKRAPPHYEQQKTDPCPSVSLSRSFLFLLYLYFPPPSSGACLLVCKSDRLKLLDLSRFKLQSIIVSLVMCRSREREKPQLIIRGLCFSPARSSSTTSSWDDHQEMWVAGSFSPFLFLALSSCD